MSDTLEELLAAQARDLRKLAAIDRTYPLSTRVLWVNEQAACDQRRAVIGAMTSDVAVVLGGWRSGKSEGLKQLNVASAMGGDHPAVRMWLELNDLPRDAIPDGPAETYLIAQSSNDSVKYHRDSIDRLVGPWGTWYNRNGKGEALLTVARPNSKALGKIWFKSVDQGRRAFQGISIRRGDIDEEPLGADGFQVFDELRARAADQAGRLGIAMVPMEGLTWVFEKLIQEGKYGARHFELDSLDNPHLPRDFAKLYAGMSEDEIAVRRRGQFRARTGAVFPMWAAGDGSREGPGHMCDDFEIPADWIRFRMGDFGLVNPTCILWGALDPDDCLYIYGEYYQPNGDSYPWHAERVRSLELGDAVEITPATGDPYTVSLGSAQSIETGWGDPAAKEAREAFATAGVGMVPANNDVKGGIDRIKERLRIRGDNRPRLKVFRSCRNLLREMPAQVWDPSRRDEVPLKKDDHSVDALRYGCNGIVEWKGLV